MSDENAPQKSMFIVKAKPESLQTAESWLKGKNWAIDSTDQIKDALPRILAMKPQFIVLCMDHPNQKIRMLPKLFEQAFQTKVIAYLEGTSPSSLAAIAGMEYVLYPPITGTAIDRMTSKVERDRRRKEQMEAQRAQNGMGKASLGTTDTGVIAIKGGAMKAEENILASEQAKKTLMQMMGADTSLVSSSATAPNPMSHGLWNGTHHDSEKNEGSLQTNARTAHASSASAAPGVSDEDVAAALRAMLDPSLNRHHGNGENKKQSAVAEAESAAKTRMQSREQDAALKKAKILSSHTNAEMGYDENTGLVLGTQKALDEIAKATPNAEILPLDETQEGICFFVTSKNHSGFVLCSIAHNTDPLHAFVDIFKNRLTELMNDIDGDFLASSALEVTMPVVNFDNWVQNQAAFSRKFVHEDRECGLAFFELTPPKPDVAPSVRKDFVQMKLVDVREERKLGFNVFLYLPVNNKFILYTRRGGKFAELQKKRLLSRGVSAVHLHENELDQMHRVHVEAYLDQCIAQYYESSKMSVDASN